MARPRELGDLLFQALAVAAKDREAFLDREVADPAVRAQLRELLADGDQSIEVELPAVEPVGRVEPPTLVDASGGRRAQSRVLPLGGDGGGADGSDAPSLLGRTFGNIRILELLGEGGMGEVYLGLDEKLERKVAVKTIRGEWIADQAARGRFLREARILSRLDHPDICKIYDYVEAPGVRLLVLELVDGRELTAAIADGMTQLQSLEVARRIAAVLVAAHAAGVVHRDLKPGNVMLTADGAVKVLDFGIARSLEGDDAGELIDPPPRPFGPARGSPADEVSQQMTRTGSVLGTPRYMSPEQARGEAATPASDLFSFGLMLQELLTRRPPHPHDLPMAELMARVGVGELDRVSGLAPPLAALIAELTALDPKARPTAADVVRRLAAVQDAPRRRLRRLLAAAVVGAFVLLAAKYTYDLRVERNRAIAAQQATEQARQEAERLGREAQEVVDYLVGLFEVSDPGESRGASVTARELLDAGAKKVREQLADQPLVQARLAETIGIVYRELGLLDDGISLLEMALELRRRELGPKHLDVARSLNFLGHALWERGRYQTAEPLLREALAIRQDALGPADVQVATVLDNLGSVLEIQGRYGEAEPLFSRALAIREARLGPQSIEVASSLDDLAVLYFDQGQAAKAEPLARRALDIRRAVLGSDHPEVATSANSLGIALATQGRWDDATVLLRESLAIRSKLLGPDDATVAQILSNLGQIQFLRGDLDGASDLLARALVIWDRRLGRQHPSTAITLSALADIDEKRGRHAQAEARYREAAAIFEAKQGADHPNLLEPLPKMAAIAAAAGRRAEAASLYRRALAICRAHRPADDPQCQDLERALAGVDSG
jgi:serine/threonine-protein kinase